MIPIVNSMAWEKCGGRSTQKKTVIVLIIALVSVFLKTRAAADCASERERDIPHMSHRFQFPIENRFLCHELNVVISWFCVWLAGFTTTLFVLVGRKLKSFVINKIRLSLSLSLSVVRFYLLLLTFNWLLLDSCSNFVPDKQTKRQKSSCQA